MRQAQHWTVLAHDFRIYSVVGGLHQSEGAVRVEASWRTKGVIASPRKTKRLQNGGVVADGVMVGSFTERFVRCPKWNKWDEWCKWPGQRQCCWRVSFTAGKGVILDRNIQKPCCETDCTVTTCRPPLIPPPKT